MYRAFFSYSRGDERAAGALHRAMDGYRTPRGLKGQPGVLGPVPGTLHPIFRDRTDLSGGGRLDGKIRAALENSETLVVLCSPNAAASHWVDQEVSMFLALGRHDRIFPVIAPGLPDVHDVEEAFFPPSLRGHGLLAADLREARAPSGRIIGDGRTVGRLKLLAGLLGLELDALRTRDERRRRALTSALAAASIAFASVALAAGYFAWDAQRKGVSLASALIDVVAQRDRAEEALAREEAARLEERRQRDRADTEASNALRQRDNALQAQTDFLMGQARTAYESADIPRAIAYATDASHVSTNPAPEALDLLSRLRQEDRFEAAFVADAQGRMAWNDGYVATTSGNTISVADDSTFVTKRAIRMQARVVDVALLDNGDVIGLDNGGRLQRWNSDRAQTAWTAQADEGEEFQLSRGGRRVAVLGDRLHVFEARTGDVVTTIEHPHCPEGMQRGRMTEIDRPSCALLGVEWLGQDRLLVAGAPTFAGVVDLSSGAWLWEDWRPQTANEAYPQVAANERGDAFAVARSVGSRMSLSRYQISDGAAREIELDEVGARSSRIGFPRLNFHPYRGTFAVSGFGDTILIVEGGEGRRSMDLSIPQCIDNPATRRSECSNVFQGYSRRGDYFVRVRGDGRVVIFGSENGSRRADYNIAPGIVSATLDEDGVRLMTLHDDGVIRIHSLLDQDNARRRGLLTRAFAWGPDGRTGHAFGSTLEIVDNNRRGAAIRMGGSLDGLDSDRQGRVWISQSLADDGQRSFYLHDPVAQGEPRLLWSPVCRNCATASASVVSGPYALLQASEILRPKQWRLVELATGRVMREQNVDQSSIPRSLGLRSPSLGAEGRWVVIQAENGVRAIEVASGRENVIAIPYVHLYQVHPTRPVLAAVAMLRSQEYISGIWDLATGEQLCAGPRRERAMRPVFSPSGDLFAVSTENEVAIVRSSDCSPIAEQEFSQHVQAVTFSPSDEMVAVMAGSFVAWIYSVRPWRQLQHIDDAADVSFSLDNQSVGFIAQREFHQVTLVRSPPRADRAWASLASALDRLPQASTARIEPCDRYGGLAYDPDRVAIAYRREPERAISACEDYLSRNQGDARRRTQFAGALRDRAMGQTGEQRAATLQQAWTHASRAARANYPYAIYLQGEIASVSGAQTYDPGGAVALYRRAGELGVVNAWDTLGEVYRDGRVDVATGRTLIAPSPGAAQRWFDRAADAGFSFALARRAAARDMVLRDACASQRSLSASPSRCARLAGDALDAWRATLAAAERERWSGDLTLGWRARVSTLVRMSDEAYWARLRSS